MLCSFNHSQKSSAKYVESENYHTLVQQQYELEIAGFRAESESLQLQLEQMEEGDLDEYRSIIAAMQSQKSTLSAKMRSIGKAHKAQMHSVQQERADLKAVAVSLSEEKAAVCAQLEGQREHIRRLQTQIAEYVAAEEAAKREKSEMSRQIEVGCFADHFYVDCHRLRH